ncbi:MAG: metallophosphoesterase [Eubacterium sp.]|nr:metallophosphoesterase [Eubacterium sp.]
MKILHCADIHLDSAMTANLDKDKAKERKSELLASFKDMVAYAVKENIRVIIIAGDLFDTRNISVGAKKEVDNIIINNPDIMFYYLQGNHDNGSFLAFLEEVPGNLRMFGKEWTSYNAGVIDNGSIIKNVVITGVELDSDNSGKIYGSLSLNAGNYNIVVLHGQEASHISKNNAQVISLKDLRNRGIDYLALGHVHEYSSDRLDARGVYCYPGCLEGRGFDEAGEHGFVILDIDEVTGKSDTYFVPFARRNVYVAQVDVTGCANTFEIEQCVRKFLAASGYAKESLVKIELTGTLDVECEKNTDYLCKQFESGFFAFKIKDCTQYKVDYMSYEHDVSLKGEFIRNVMARENINEQDKAEIIRYGLQALQGEEIG